MDISIEVFLQLIRLGLGTSIKPTLPEDVNWEEVEALAEQQGLSAIVLDGIEKLPEASRPSQILLLKWIGEVLQGYEYRYEAYKKAIAELAGFYSQHGFKMMVLKGYACSLNWPKPEHRPCGDIDIWQFGQQKEADTALERDKGIKIDNSHHHHTVFNWGDFVVENHYDFINVYHHKSNRSLEKIFKELGGDDKYSIIINGEKIYLPSNNLHALFILRQIMTDFASTSITLRQLLDWAFYVKEHGSEINWLWLEGVLNKYGGKSLYGVFNAICVENLGFNSMIFHSIQFSPILKERILKEIINPVYSRNLPPNAILRMTYKYKRWKSNGWKHRLCYNESMWSAFWNGAWSHILKPNSI